METLDQITLQRLYVDEQLTIRAIAKQLNISTHRVYDAMERWHIPRRPASARANRPANAIPLMESLDKSTLYQLYIEEQLSIRAIAEKLNVNPRLVYDAMMRWRIPRRSISARTNRPAPDFPCDEVTLRYHYLDLGLTIKEIAVLFNISRGLVLSAMKYWQIPRRRCGPKPKRPWPPSS